LPLEMGSSCPAAWDAACPAVGSSAVPPNEPVARQGRPVAPLVPIRVMRN
jgi:hypothetical protein